MFHIDHEIHGFASVGMRVYLEGVVIDISVRPQCTGGVDRVNDHVKELSWRGIDQIHVWKHMVFDVSVRKRLDDSNSEHGVGH
ncbi:hypothetical protein OGAPHI_006147 [Ogataea philodendri]|uniref:Uncharacterized protein n=1 Tax=Ogataea philodendri TaxID=1378263 RepID=A0A9P8T0P0_9ASCO|nr:uncharacterized protein OGAPHI_006147 [Ogataea philodendri]KAH3661968.1 hypothetical protein OGAPHI_006147 [Ogataea philodendri]